ILFTAMSVKFLFYVVFQVLAVCFNLYYLIPKFLEKSRFTEYVIYLLLTILAASLLIVPGYYLAAFFCRKNAH
ncbi:MAG: sensor histidine kinase, partial [Dyadobacter sp.]